MQPLNKVHRARRVHGAPGSRHAWKANRRTASPKTISTKKRPAPQSTNLWNMLALSLIAATFIYASALGGQMNDGWQQVQRNIDRLIGHAGFSIEQIQIIGLRNLTEAEITQALAIVDENSLPAFDTDGAQKTLENLSWVRAARVMRIFPATLRVEIEEREPLAYWQYKSATYLIGDDGEVILSAKPGAYGKLPLIVGEGAPHHAAAILATLMRYPEVATKVKALIRVADRRWTVKLRQGPDILLPETKTAAALNWLVSLEKKHKLLRRQLEMVDLRIAGRVVLRPAKPSVKSRTQRIGSLPKPSIISSSGGA